MSLIDIKKRGKKKNKRKKEKYGGEPLGNTWTRLHGSLGSKEQNIYMPWEKNLFQRSGFRSDSIYCIV